MGAGAAAVPLVVIDDFIAADEWRGHFKSNLKSGEIRLMLELLIDAIRLYLGDVGRLKRKQWPEAEAWIGEDNDLLFGFANVCECLGIDKNYLRAGLRKARKEPGRHHIARARARLRGADRDLGESLRERGEAQRAVDRLLLTSVD